MRVKLCVCSPYNDLHYVECQSKSVLLLFIVVVCLCRDSCLLSVIIGEF